MISSLFLALSLAIPLALPRTDWARLRVSLIYFWRHGYFPDLKRPQFFNEKVQWRKLCDRDLSLAALTDKLYAKSLAADIIGPSLVIPTLWQGEQLPGSPPWPMPFIVKSNHGCGQFVVVRCDRDWTRAQRESPKWLVRAYGEWLDEWHYRRAGRTLIVEPFIGPKNGLPNDYKIFVFAGVAEFIQVHVDRGANHRWVQYDRQWTKLSNSPETIEAPVQLTQMLLAAEQIAFGRDHLRVDFYEIDGRLWFGETCLFPGSGLDPFDPLSLHETFGHLWGIGAKRFCQSQAADALALGSD
ncbi:MAG TPA: ATP-grasp fold amidoligase family protein [Sphingomicrobium sp.]|nr:ATP-grasp fold amidoligase family protein [Sphingomicrobium sp.]